MIALAILLLIAAAAIVVWVVMGLNGNNANTIHFDAPGINTDIKPLTLFLLGALALLLIWAATRLIAAGTKRKYRKHQEMRELKREHKEQEKIYKRENKKHDRADAARASHGTAHRDYDVRDERREVVGDERGEVRNGAHEDLRTQEIDDEQRVSDQHLDADDVKKTGRHYS